MLPEFPFQTEATAVAPVIERPAVDSSVPTLLATKGKVNYCILPPELNYIAKAPDDPIVLPPEFTVLAAFDDKGLAGRTTVVTVPHIEGTWVREDLRKTRIGYVMFKEMENFVRSLGRTHTLAYAYDEQPEVADYLARLGYERLPLTIWAKDLTKETK